MTIIIQSYERERSRRFCSLTAARLLSRRYGHRINITMTSLRKSFALLCAATLWWTMAPHCASSSDYIGVQQITATSKERGIDLDVTVWYPALPGGKPVVLGESTFFMGTPAMLDAPISDGEFPLILLSHGAGLAGNAQALSWIAAPLAKQGFVVAAPTHPGNTGPNRSAAETVKLWLRPADISETLNTIEKSAFFDQHIEHSKIGALGLSAGGNTVLALAGARIDPKLLAGYCDTDLLNPSLCGWVRQSGVDLHAMDMHLANRDNRDEHIRFVMAIDPAPVDVFRSNSFSEISIPVDLVNLGEPGNIPMTAQAAEISKVISNARYLTIGDASHYSMFAECKPHAAEIADAEKIGDPICSDGGGRSRGEIHTQLIRMVTDAFNREFVSNH